MRGSRHQRLRARGFTLVELMVTVGVASIVGATFFSVVYMQSLSYLERLDEYDAHQNARAALNVVRRYVQGDRFGLAQDANAAGVVLVGKCFTGGSPTTANGACNNVPADGGADRLRLVALINDTEFVGNTAYASGNTCDTNSPDDPTLIHANQAQRNPLLPGTLAGIGGSCYSPTGITAASDVVQITADLPGGSCAHRYRFTQLESGAATLTCANGYDRGFGFGRATVADFFIGLATDGSPSLMLSLDPRLPPMVVGFDVEDLQVRYGIDASVPPDGGVDLWCDDPRTPGDGGTCPSVTLPGGTALLTQDNYNRIVAVQVALRVRTSSPRPNVFPSILDPNWTVAHPVANNSDGYRRWIYTATVQLRNNNVR